MPRRREALKIIGAIGTTCAFPFSADELYGQHVHPAPGPQSSYAAPKFFTAQEYATISRLADLIIPATDTPGAAAAGVPAYIDYVVDANQEWRKLFRNGLTWLHDQRFDQLNEHEQIALLTPLIDGPGDELPVMFLRAVKGMTADGYYTSKIGLVEELGYKGNTVLASFPSCEVPEH